MKMEAEGSSEILVSPLTTPCCNAETFIFVRTSRPTWIILTPVAALYLKAGVLNLSQTEDHIHPLL
jgi:hypothetical protein